MVGYWAGRNYLPARSDKSPASILISALIDSAVDWPNVRDWNPTMYTIAYASLTINAESMGTRNNFKCLRYYYVNHMSGRLHTLVYYNQLPIKFFFLPTKSLTLFRLLSSSPCGVWRPWQTRVTVSKRMWSYLFCILRSNLWRRLLRIAVADIQPVLIVIHDIMQPRQWDINHSAERI